MVHRVQLPRLNRLDVEALMRAHLALVAVDRALRESKRADAAPLIELVGTADQVIGHLFNKAEVSVIRQAAAPAAESPAGGPLEQGPGESANQPQIGSSARPEP